MRYMRGDILFEVGIEEARLRGGEWVGIGVGAVIGNLEGGVLEMRFNAEKVFQRHGADTAIE